MTQIKRSGILMYFDMKPVLERLSDHEVKELLLAILDYGENGVVPEFHSATLACFWPLLASRMDADRERYQQRVESNRRAAIEMIRRFKQAGAQISLDVNYRANLWSESDAYATLQTVLPMVDVLFVSEETSRRMFRKTGTRDAIMRSYCTEYGVSVVAATDRVVINPHKHDFGSTIYDAESDRFFTEPPYRGIEVVDRIGSGDAYISGVLYGLLCDGGSCRKALAYGNAVICSDIPENTAVCVAASAVPVTVSPLRS